eukprot:509713_1
MLCTCNIFTLTRNSFVIKFTIYSITHSTEPVMGNIVSNNTTNSIEDKNLIPCEYCHELFEFDQYTLHVSIHLQKKPVNDAFDQKHTDDKNKPIQTHILKSTDIIIQTYKELKSVLNVQSDFLDIATVRNYKLTANQWLAMKSELIKKIFFKKLCLLDKSRDTFVTGDWIKVNKYYSYGFDDCSKVIANDMIAKLIEVTKYNDDSNTTEYWSVCGWDQPNCFHKNVGRVFLDHVCGNDIIDECIRQINIRLSQNHKCWWEKMQLSFWSHMNETEFTKMMKMTYMNKYKVKSHQIKWQNPTKEITCKQFVETYSDFVSESFFQCKIAALGYNNPYAIWKYHQEIIDETKNEINFEETYINKLHQTQYDEDNEYKINSSYIKQIETCNGWKNCNSVLRLIKLMCTYNAKENVNDCYNITEILNDYGHFVTTHSNNDLEAISECLLQNNKCKLETCDVFVRSMRDRSLQKNDENYIKNPHVYQQICDKIHCYLYHIYDIGMAIQTDDIRSTKECSVESILQLIKQQKDNMPTIRGFDRRIGENNKFCSIVQDTKENKENESVSTYSFGIRYDYWDKCNQNYLAPKYPNLKQELLGNNIVSICWEQYNNLIRKSFELKNTQYCRQIIAWKSYRDYSITIHDIIRLADIICILVYCNFDNFQAIASKTFRSKSDNDTKDHQHFVNFAKQLTECVQCFGERVNRYNIDKTKRKMNFYHGISTEMLFLQLSATFNCPTSTSYNIAVAMNFANNQGLVLQLINCNDYSRYFECENYLKWIKAISDIQSVMK